MYVTFAADVFESVRVIFLLANFLCIGSNLVLNVTMLYNIDVDG